MIVEAASGRMPAYIDTGLNLVHVEDVAAGILPPSRKGASANVIFSGAII